MSCVAIGMRSDPSVGGANGTAHRRKPHPKLFSPDTLEH